MFLWVIDSQSESSRSFKLERQPSNLIDSFAQTETHNVLLDTATGGSSSDMVDSGVDSQHKSIFKERNVSVTEDEEGLSFSEDRYREKIIILSEEEEEEEVKKEEVEEVSHSTVCLLHSSSKPSFRLLC